MTTRCLGFVVSLCMYNGHEQVCAVHSAQFINLVKDQR